MKGRLGRMIESLEWADESVAMQESHRSPTLYPEEEQGGREARQGGNGEKSVRNSKSVCPFFAHDEKNGE